MKVGDLVYCPIDLSTGEMFTKNWELAVITAISKNEPKINVAYVKKHDSNIVMGTWFTEELKLASES